MQANKPGYSVEAPSAETGEQWGAKTLELVKGIFHLIDFSVGKENQFSISKMIINFNPTKLKA